LCSAFSTELQHFVTVQCCAVPYNHTALIIPLAALIVALSEMEMCGGIMALPCGHLGGPSN